MLTIDIHKGLTADVGHTGTTEHPVQRVALHHDNLRVAAHMTLIAAAIDVTADLNLCLSPQR